MPHARVPSHASRTSSPSDVADLIVVGSGGVGKSCLTIRFLKGDFSAEYDPTIEENFRKSIVVDGIPCIVNIVDTAGQHEYAALRDQHLTSGNGFLLVFAVNDKASFEEAKELREQIVKIKNTKRVPILLVANKCDLPMEQREVDQKTMQAYAQQVKVHLLETSAKSNINVTEAFHELVREFRRRKMEANDVKEPRNRKKKSKSNCVIV